MAITLDGTNGITTPDVDSTTSVTTPLVTNAGRLALSATGANIITASTNGAERLRIDSAGALNVGTTSNQGGLITVNRVQSSGVAQMLTLRCGSSGNLSTFNYFADPVAGTALRFDYGGAYLAIRDGTTERLRIDSSGNLQFNSGYGSVATAFGCRAWVNFNGTGTVAIRASGNVSSITDNGAGSYAVNLTTAMPDINYAVVASSRDAGVQATFTSTAISSTSVAPVFTLSTAGSSVDANQVYVAIFR
jgi:hypothetical protein